MSETKQIAAKSSQEITHNYLNADQFAQMQRVAVALSKSSMVPKDYQGGEQGMANCLIAIEMSARMQLSPMVVMQNLYIVHGKPTWKAEFVISMLKASPQFSSVEFQKDHQDGGRCRVVCTRADGRRVEGTWVSMKMAAAEGWSTKTGSKWKTMPEQMLMYRAATFFARVHAPELLNGVRPDNEVMDIEHQEVKEDLNDRIQFTQQDITEVEDLTNDQLDEL
jgi:hypothetical protein